MWSTAYAIVAFGMKNPSRMTAAVVRLVVVTAVLAATDCTDRQPAPD